MRVVLSQNAEKDLEAIGDWIAQDNPTRAVTFVDELLKACRGIGRSPKSFPLVDRSREAHLRRRVFRDYLIFYEVGQRLSRYCTSFTAQGTTS